MVLFLSLWHCQKQTPVALRSGRAGGALIVGRGSGYLELKSFREQVAQTVDPEPFLAETDDDLGVIIHELGHHLAARSARHERARFVRVAVDAGTGQHRDASLAGRYGLEDSDAFRTHREAKAPTLDVAARVDCAAFPHDCGAYGKVRVGRARVLCGSDCMEQKFLRVHMSSSDGIVGRWNGKSLTQTDNKTSSHGLRVC